MTHVLVHPKLRRRTIPSLHLDTFTCCRANRYCCDPFTLYDGNWTSARNTFPFDLFYQSTHPIPPSMPVLRLTLLPLPFFYLIHLFFFFFFFFILFCFFCFFLFSFIIFILFLSSVSNSQGLLIIWWGVFSSFRPVNAVSHLMPHAPYLP
ncbi:hypothetical protein TcWFU_008608 [Taenia crassiceps]|uniref:Uncharacterized protein n=1 Tax=Taenia crassiceps TaxID=6207 RepID=A0ABR4QT42_9CEST